MEIYSVGEDLLSDYDLADVDASRFQWLAYDYESRDYSGDGFAVLLRMDGTLVYKNLAHRSCFCPLYGCCNDAIEISRDAFFKKETDIHRDIGISDRLKTRVAELLGVPYEPHPTLEGRTHV